MSEMDRREFMRHSALIGGAGLAGSVIPWSRVAAARRRPSMLDLPAKEAPVDHIVVLMMENRSFDHYLGWLANDETYVERGLRRFGSSFRINGDTSQNYADPDGKSYDTFYLPEADAEHYPNPYRGCEHPDPGHGWDQGRAQRDHGFLAEDSGNDAYALGYYKASDFPVYERMVRRFTIFDRFHCSVLGPTYPNREYLHSAQSGGIKDNSLPVEEQGYQWETIWDRMIAAGVPCRYYFVDLPTTGLWGPRLAPITSHIERYFEDCAAGTLPEVTFIDPGFTTDYRTDDHPHADIRSGQKYIYNAFKAFVESPHWESGMFVITYDEWGGFFDHVAPPHLPDPRASEKDVNDFSQAGFRVPALMASPFARVGFVDNRLYDHTSILRFIQWRFLGAPPEGPKGNKWWLTKRDRYANNIGHSLRPKGMYLDFNFDAVAEVPVESPPCEDQDPDPFPAPVVQERFEHLQKHSFEQALEEGFFERMGHNVRMKPLPY